MIYSKQKYKIQNRKQKISDLYNKKTDKNVFRIQKFNALYIYTSIY